MKSITCAKCGKKVHWTSSYCFNCGVAVINQDKHDASIDSQNEGSLLKTISREIIFASNFQSSWPLYIATKLIEDEDGIMKMNFGYINLQNEWVFLPVFDGISWFNELGYAEISIDSKWGLIDKNGQVIFQPRYDGIQRIENDNEHFVVSMADKEGILNLNNNWVIDPIYESVEWFVGEKAIVYYKGKAGIINTNKVWVIEPIYESIAVYGNYVIVENENEYGIIDFSNNSIKDIQYEELIFDEESNCFVARQNGFYGIVNPQGEWQVEPKWEQIIIVNSRHLIVQINEKSGVIDYSENWLIKPSYVNIFPAADNLFLVQTESDYYELYYGLVNINGDFILECEYKEITPFYAPGIAVVVNKSNQCALLNKNGSFITPFEFHKIHNIDGDKEIIVFEVAQKFGCMDLSGNLLISPTFDYMESFDDNNIAYAEIDEHYGWIDINGVWVINPDYPINSPSN
ncbi:WG repeat-containing protein [Draconibacterium sediminis]|uniref:WG repeat-containing protein n=1 Tax=Draconibacterium sediminis TaxID=1544798 RepID=A0A0D8JEM5_9BACT|nr:WG repeat-containing protein [Draconibacterium sediminis]KJF44278.1 hypothetical protein LH29_01825 [Draconibacterium sediminis]